MAAAGHRDLFENPMGTDGFEFVEYTAPDPAQLRKLFEQMGFPVVARHRSKDVTLHTQGDINFIINAEPDSFAQAFARAHGPSVCAMAFRVKDATLAFKRAVELGAKPFEGRVGPMELNIPAIEGIGGSLVYLVDRYGDRTIYDVDFVPVANRGTLRTTGLSCIDHLTHNVHRGNMNKWAGFYEKLFNFRELRYFDIQGEYTGLASKAMTAPDGRIRIPLNEESSRGSGQIEEFLMKFNGEGIQHIALLTDDILHTIDALRASGVPLMTPPPATYYEMLDERLPGHGQPVEALRARGILVDGTTEGGSQRLLLQ
ncbi:MAG TPA: 4-hydroxyphenylpyruvate dioxygenase, partial [Steroidobacteraceae bacterium]|nr:4-hydroxyphenylpyruvate dioxygenase [Steroidobacteraceae bacterium]